MAKTARNWAIAYVLSVVLTLLWHQGIFGSLYPSHLDPIIVKDAAGNPSPRMPFFLLAHVPVAFGFVLYVMAVARSRAGFVAHGAMMGFVSFGTFTLLSHGLFQNWSSWLMWMDVCFGFFSGAITGLVMSYLAPTASARSSARVG